MPELDPARIVALALVVEGGHDLDHSRVIAKHLAQRLPNARHVLLPWAGDLPNLERPHEVTALLLNFLAAPMT